jgi:hypothetical protein
MYQIYYSWIQKCVSSEFQEVVIYRAISFILSVYGLKTILYNVYDHLQKTSKINNQYMLNF